MSFVRSLSIVAVAIVSTFAAAGCSSAEGASSDDVTLTGRIGSGSTSTRAFGGLTASDANLHVVARRVHRRGERGGVVDVAVGPDGTFRLDVARGSRWIVTVDGSGERSAMVAFGNGGKNVLSVGASEDGAVVDLGGVKISGGQAYADVAIDGRFGLAATLAELDEIYESATGAIEDAREAVAAAQKAAEDARAAADQARSDADDARKAAEDARAAAGL